MIKKVCFLKRAICVACFVVALMASTTARAQQLPNASFEDWSGAAFDGNIQPKSWNASNVTQFGFKFNFAHRETGHTGSYSMMVQDQEIGAAGITEVSPGYFSLGQPWVYIAGLTKVSEATAGTYGGVNWTYRPDSMSVWIKRTGPNVDKEDFYLLYYAWKGTAIGTSYKGKNTKCTSHTETNEESDIRQALDHNECSTSQYATQICEGMWRERCEYDNWTNIRVPIYYMNNDEPEMMNIIFSASNYPNYRANSGLYKENSLYIDDVELIYSDKIQMLYVGGIEWKGFDPNSSDEQVYSLGEKATTIPAIEAWRGSGVLTNASGESATFTGRKLTSSECVITNGAIDGSPTTITVTSGDGLHTRTYKIKFIRAASTNTKLADITVNGTTVPNFSPSVTSYNVALPYGTTATPVVAAVAQESEQTVQVTQASSTTGKATIKVTAADGKATATYTIQFSVAQLADNTLADILVNGQSIPGFSPSATIYKVSLPLGTTSMPTVQAVSAYPAGAQTIRYTAPAVIDGGQYQIAVTTPGNPTPKTYKLNFKLEASSYSYLKDLKVGGVSVDAFEPTLYTYYVNLPLGTTQLPAITYTTGDAYQTVTVQEGGLDGTTRVTVTAGDGSTQSVYKLIVSTEKSDRNDLSMIYVGGTPLEGFSPDQLSYSYGLPIGTSALPEITVDKGDEFETVNVVTGGLNGTTRITVKAGDGSTRVYQIAFSVATSSDATLSMIYVGGVPVEGFSPAVLEYDYALPMGTSTLPEVTFDQHDAYQTVTTRAGGVNGDYRLTVRPQTGSSQTYIIHFSVATNSNNKLAGISVGGTPLADFDPEVLSYSINLPEGVSAIPTVAYVKGDETQKVLSVLENNVQTITVTAASGSKRVYTITFVIQKSENAFLQMIYLDGAPLAGFDPQILSYSVPLTTPTCPVITVEKNEGQQVAISAPYGVGVAHILVTPEVGGSNDYTITFTQSAVASVQLQDILLDGVSLDGFDPAQLTYTATYTDHLPVVSYVAEAGRMVQVLWNGSTVMLYVTDGVSQAAYSVAFSRTESNDASLQMIYLDGVALVDFAPATLDYIHNLPAGSSYPVVSFTPASTAQVTYFGQAEKGKWIIVVMAEDGTTTQSYTVSMPIAKYDNALLQNLEVAGQTLAFVETTLVYDLSLDEGAALPELTITTRPGQTAVVSNPTLDQQQIRVTAESGATNTYIINYARVLSDNALLADIKIAGVSLDGFDPAVHVYTYTTLPIGTKVIPAVQAVGQLENQIITTHYCRPGNTLSIHVEAQDGTTSDYTVAFPVAKSNNCDLGGILIDFDPLDFVFNKNITDYDVELPYQTSVVPPYSYEKGAANQTVREISRPLGDTTQIIVTAEDGTERSYNLYFHAAEAPSQNLLREIYIEELDRNLSLVDKTKRDFDVTLPYGARSMTVRYTKSYDEQTVFVEDGGINHPTVITVKSNKKDVADEVYTLNPVLTTQNPAVLTSIKVDGVDIPGFDPNRFTYVVNRTVTTTPKLTVTRASGIEYDPTTDLWKSILVISAGDCSNTYEIYYHYTNDVIPNAEFTEWGKTSNSNTDKPTGWNAPGDFIGTYAYTAKAGPSVQKESATVVHLNTTYWAALAGPVPAVINIGSMSAKFAVAGGTTVTPSGFIGFHNTPDQVTMNYKYPNKAGNGALFRYRFFDIDGNTTDFDHTASTTSSAYASQTINLATNGIGVNGLDVIIDASGRYPSGSNTADLYVDWIRFSYNSKLTGANVNGTAAVKDGNAFTVTLPDAEDINLRSYKFTGEVIDQAQELTWENDGAETISGDFAVRNAAVRNYAEDGTYTDYTLAVRRPLCTNNSLDSIYVGGTKLLAFDADQLSYDVHISSTAQLPDLQPFAGSSRQTVSTAFAANTMTITVTPESGEAKVYTVHFVVDRSSDATLAGLVAEGVTYDPDELVYNVTAERMPDITFTKKMDGQVVDCHDGVVAVTAEDGTTRTYRINLTLPATSGIIDEFEFEGNVVAGFGGDEYTITRERPELTAFARHDERDSIIYTQTATEMTWRVLGTSEHTYTLTYPSTLSNNAKLAGILVNGTMVDGFDPDIDEYVVVSDVPVVVTPVLAEDAQVIAMTATNNNYVLEVTAENGTSKANYKVHVRGSIGESAELSMITLDGVDLEGFDPTITNYVVTLPCGDIKTALPVMPSVAYMTAEPGATVELAPAGIGEVTYFDVTAEDGISQKHYQLTVQSEKSHNSDLTGIVVNNVPVDHFEAGRHYYSLSSSVPDVELTWTADDRFQDYELLCDTTEFGYEYRLTVKAEDGLHTQVYQVDVFVQALSNDATLANIRLDGQEINDFLRAINTVSFDANQNLYDINLLPGTTLLPEVSAVLSMEGQSAVINKDGMTVRIIVTAKDGKTTNTYTLRFHVPQSSNAQLSMIYLDGDSLAGFSKSNMFYMVNLPVGVHSFPEVVGQKDEAVQTISDPVVAADRVTLHVTAEDGTSLDYVVVFSYTFSDADTLQMIYEDGLPMAEFVPTTFYYNRTLPVGTTAFPELGWLEADEYQTIAQQVVSETASMRTVQIAVTSESGRTGLYTIVYEIEKSAVNMLKMIYLNNDSLDGFASDIEEYSFTLPAGAIELPEVLAIPGDEYQTITMIESSDSIATKSLNKKVTIFVQAQNGTSRSYVIHFPVALSSDATLNMIQYGGMPISNFDSEVMTYTQLLAENDTVVPAITVIKKEDAQNVDIYIDHMLVTIHVLAEDGVTEANYQIAFAPRASSNAALAAILLDNQPMADFQPAVYEYRIVLPVGTTENPVVTWTAAYDAQRVESTAIDNMVVLTVTAADGETVNEYNLIFEVALSDNCQLSAISVFGEALAGFAPDTYEYTLEYAVGSTTADFAAENDVVATVDDTAATVSSLLVDENGNISITVTAASGKAVTYTIHQVIALDDNNFLSMIYLNDVALNDFDPNVDFYSFVLRQGVTVPVLTCETESESATFSIKVGQVGDTTMITCVAENGDIRYYYVYFYYSTLHEANRPTSSNVFVKPIPGTSDVLVATIRNNVSFALYDHQGHMITYLQNIKTAEPSEAVVYVDPTSGEETLLDVTNPSSGEVIRLIPNQVYMYSFYELDKNRIATGKIMIRQ